MSATVLLDHPWVLRRKLDVHEYHRMGEAGILHEDDRIELIEGELIAMAPIGSPHSGTINRLTRLLVMAAGERAVVGVQNPVRLGDYSEPQPDFTVLRPRKDDYFGSTPTPADVLLLVEVSDSSLRYDRVIKLPLYARHGIPEVWIVDLAHGSVEVCREPSPDGYAAMSRERPGALLAPLLLPEMQLHVADMLVG